MKRLPEVFALVNTTIRQNILIYRKESETIEQVATFGLWIGIIDAISSLLDNSTIKLDIGDVMLLFTDGITEAWKKEMIRGDRDPRNDMFGQKKLADILEALVDYEFKDDATLVIVKRLE